jgi:hypothetical protein
VLAQMVTIRESGSERRVTAAEAFLLKLAKRGMEGDSAAARASLALIEEARTQQGTDPAVRHSFCGPRKRYLRALTAADG